MAPEFLEAGALLAVLSALGLTRPSVRARVVGALLLVPTAGLLACSLIR